MPLHMRALLGRQLVADGFEAMSNNQKHRDCAMLENSVVCISGNVLSSARAVSKAQCGRLIYAAENYQ